MENKLKVMTQKETRFYIDLISNRFLNNPRMTMLFGKKKDKKFRKNVKNLVTYCFKLAQKMNGVYVAKNEKTIVLFYEKKHYHQNIRDYIRYLKIVLGIGLARLTRVLENEKIIAKHKLKISNYLYIWFIAQEKAYGKIDGLIEINNMIFDYAIKKNIPILLETSDSNLLNLYNRAGFIIYKTINQKNNTIYFLIDQYSKSKYIT